MILNPRFDSNGSHGRRGCLPDTADGAAVASSGRRQQRSIDRFVAASPRPLWRRRSTFEQGQAGFGGSASNPVAILPWERGLAGSCSLGRRPFWVEATSKGYFDFEKGRENGSQFDDFTTNQTKFCGKSSGSDFERLDRVKFPTACKSLVHYWSQNKSKDIFQLGSQRPFSEKEFTVIFQPGNQSRWITTHQTFGGKNSVSDF